MSRYMRCDCCDREMGESFSKRVSVDWQAYMHTLDTPYPFDMHLDLCSECAGKAFGALKGLFPERKVRI